jgi:hypothetical protein
MNTTMIVTYLCNVLEVVGEIKAVIGLERKGS